MAAALKAIYTAPTESTRKLSLNEFNAGSGQQYPAIVASSERNWQKVILMFSYPPAIRRAIHTTNAIESLNFSLRKFTKTKGAFPSKQAAMNRLNLKILNQCQRGATFIGSGIQPSMC
ncbi:hypothetical protein DC3_56910 [Deinococcus cellulosilyticus NBRC 106333 = KACC 11606]|uniref:Mutator family transposase n=1 Tax=Deinococcus cellulosilyticus (strain DSM 18568 / NBRC 106333 / KACC 11606 / 5516J-15) TaxID=1223518 RepID=A0A511NBW7_DEIC1|nr:hypothetical protein DC3_56910 [Deinococcus cellulosilyticus NBRC 106333 = KACC 11606]